jgi:hypothetical protein
MLPHSSAMVGLCITANRRAGFKRCPLYPRKRTLVERVVMSALCQKQTHAAQQKDRYSITSSARMSSVGGKARPSAFAVMALSLRP